MWVFHNQRSWNLNAAIWVQEFSEHLEIAFPDQWIIRVYGYDKEKVEMFMGINLTKNPYNGNDNDYKR